MVAMQQTVSVIGAGPAGFALAADLHFRGASVLIYSHPDHLKHAEAVEEKGCLTVSGRIEGMMHPHITTSMRDAVEFSRLLILTVPSTGQETILEELRNFKIHRHTIMAIPGNLISLLTDLRAACILETNLSPYACRMDNERLIVLGKKEILYVAASQHQPSLALRATIERIFPVRLRWSNSVMEVCLANVNGIFHPLMMIMNAGRIENAEGDFFLYRDGLTPSVANAMQAIDHVRMEISAALGLPISTAVEVSNECYGHTFVDLIDLAQNSAPHNKLKAPADMNNRNLSEDVPDLLVCWHDLAVKLAVDASPIQAVITMAEIATGVEYFKTGRNMQRLQLQHMPQHELIERFGGSSKITPFAHL